MGDELTGLTYLRARYYNPATGRFTQEDVIYDDGFNLYAYCGSNPVIYCDPSGFTRLNPCDRKIDPKEVNFMQSSIKNKTGEYTVLGNAKALKNGILKASGLPNIRIWKDANGKIWTLDHRRLAAFRLAGLEAVPFQWATNKEVVKQMWKMTTETGGKVLN